MLMRLDLANGVSIDRRLDALIEGHKTISARSHLWGRDIRAFLAAAADDVHSVEDVITGGDVIAARHGDSELIHGFLDVAQARTSTASGDILGAHAALNSARSRLKAAYPQDVSQRLVERAIADLEHEMSTGQA